MADKLADLRYEIAVANRILANEGILDAFGHVSARHPTNPNRYLLSRSRAPELVSPDDIYEYDLDSQPVKTYKLPPYSERVIHGEIYKARPDVMSVCHHHAPAFMPLVTTGTPFVPVFHLGAVGGRNIAIWDQQKEFGDTNLLVVKPEEGRSLAKAFGKNFMVLMWRHGVTVGGISVRETVFRSIYAARNAEYQVAGAMLGKLHPLTPGEVKLAGEINLKTTGQVRAWEYWSGRLATAKKLPKRR